MTSTLTAPVLLSTAGDLSLETRRQVADMLQAVLSLSLDLAYQVKQAHWTVRGPQFAALHELFDTLYNELTDEVIDEVAERMTAIAVVPVGTVRDAAARSPLPEYPLNARRGLDHVAALVQRYAQAARTVRPLIDQSAQAGDNVTSDLFVGVTALLDKRLWMLEAHLDADA